MMLASALAAAAGGRTAPEAASLCASAWMRAAAFTSAAVPLSASTPTAAAATAATAQQQQQQRQRLGQTPAQRGFATAAGAASFALGAAADAPLLVQLPQRAWGAAATLPASVGAPNRASLGVLREPFSAFNQTTTPIGQILRPLSSGKGVAVSTRSLFPSSKVVVDEYELDRFGGYKLTGMAVDLLAYLQKHKTKVALVPDVASADKSTAAAGIANSISQSSNEVLMVSPTAFGFNEQAAQDNSFMAVAEKPGEGSGGLTRSVLFEFADLYHQLSSVHGVNVSLFEHSLEHGTPDACFPNNWFSTHAAGEAAGGNKEATLVLYPMKCSNRAAERRPGTIDVLKSRGYSRVVDLSGEEAGGKCFEGTGVLVLDRINGVAYVNVSERAHPDVARRWVDALGYKDLVTFRSFDARGSAVYHTNVMMAIGTGVAIVCGESVKDALERKRLMDSLSKTHEVVDITLQQMDHLCGNAIEVQSRLGVPVMAMSTQAYNSFTAEQIAAIRRHVADIAHAPVDTLEKVGGGSVRCTVGELF